MQSSAVPQSRHRGVMASKPVILPETFQGTASWDDWIEHFERVAIVNEWTTAAAKLKWLKVRLTSKAMAALKRLPDETQDTVQL